MPATSESDLFDRLRFRGQPVAHPRAVVTHGDARFTVLTPRLLRLEWSSTGGFEDRGTYAFPTRYAPPPPFEAHVKGDCLVLETGTLTLRHRRGRGHLDAGNLFIAFQVGGEPQIWTPGMPNPANLRGTRRTLDKCTGDAALDEGLISRTGWALFDDSRSARFDLGDGWVVAPPQYDMQDWYFFGYGRDYQAALADYVRFGGRVPMIPRYALGAWWSRYWAYMAEELQAVVGAFEAHGLPLDVLVVDMDWHTPHAWTGYTWNHDLFPDPEAFLRWAHEKGLQVTLNLHPAQGVQLFEEVYPEFAASLGVDPEVGEAIPFRIADKAYVRSYFRLLHHPLEEQGVDFWWVDWQQGIASDLEGLDPLPWLNHLHFSDSARRGLRPMLYSRWGGLGNHRYPIGFSGDTYATWGSLQFQPYMTATASNVAYGWWSHDIGGHMGGATEPELYTRWVQFGALSPCLRLHATKDSRAERRPWAYPAPVLQAVREAFQWRYRLVPLWYTLARIAHDTGVAPCRPMYYAHPEEEAAYAARYQYFLGEALIAAPIVHPADPETGVAATDVWLPEEAWIDVSTLETYVGPGWVRLVGGLERLPLLVRAGSVLPLAAPFDPATKPRLQSGTTGDLPQDRLVVLAFPGAAGSFRLYEDDGLTEDYKEGHFEWTPIRARMDRPAVWEVEIGPTEGNCDALPDKRGYEVRLEGSRRPDEVQVDGIPHAGWTYDPQALRTTIDVPARDKGQAVRLTVLGQSGLSALGAAHNRRVVRADIQRLVGDRMLPPSDDEALLDALLRADVPGRADAVARLGGPLLRVIEFTTPEEAAQHLGRLIVGAPSRPGDTYDLEATWRLKRGGETSVHTVRVVGISESLLLDAPFAWDRRLQAARWSIDARLVWRGATLTHTHRSRALFPTIPTWQGVVLEEDSLPLERVMDSSGVPRPELDWQPFRQAASELASLDEPHEVLFSSRNLPAEGTAPASVAYLATRFQSLEVREAVLRVRAAHRVRLFLNGDEIVLQPAPEREGLIQPYFRATRQTESVHLRAGRNHLLAVVHPDPDEPVWYFEATWLTPAGEVMIDLGYD